MELNFIPQSLRRNMFNIRFKELGYKELIFIPQSLQRNKFTIRL